MPRQIHAADQPPLGAELQPYDRAQGVRRPRTRQMGSRAINMDILRSDIQAQIGTIPSPAPTPRPPVPVGEYAHILLFRGSEGPQVAQLQRQLKYGYQA